jgi:hypothetical protein
MIKPIPMRDQGFAPMNVNLGENKSNQLMQFEHYGKIFTKLSIWMMVLSAVLFALAAVLVRSVSAAPEAIILFSVYYLYYHAIHALLLLFRIFKYFFVIHPKHEGVTIGGTFVALILTPISAGFAYLASFLLLLSSCAA